MQNNNNTQGYFNSKQLKIPLSLEIKIPFDSEVRTFDEVFNKMEIKKYLNNQKDPRGRIGYNPVQMLKLILFCQMEFYLVAIGYNLSKYYNKKYRNIQ